MSTLTAPEWQGILSRVKQDNPNITRPWFNQLDLVDLDHGILEITCANLPQQRYLGEHCARSFSEAAQAETGNLITVRFTISEQHNSLGASASTSGFSDDTSQLTLTTEYIFDEFVTGPCNRLAHAACVAVGELPGETYNPLFIHGSVGLGKTHLLHAICHSIRKNNSQAKIMYLSCETFTNHFIEAVERGALNKFRFRYRHVDILLIDDIQFLAERERSQEEFFHTFNTLYQSRKQIVLSADCSPREIPSLEDRLVSRFNWGLVARIDKPCLETRMAIVLKKTRLKNIELPEDVVHFIASSIVTNSRELEGAITTIDATSQQLGQPINLHNAKQALGVESVAAKSVSLPEILDAVAQHYYVKKSDMLGKRRNKSIAFPRQVCMYLTRKITNYSLEEIGRYFGGRDHTTVMHAVRLINKIRTSDENMSATLKQLTNQILDGSSG